MPASSTDVPVEYSNVEPGSVSSGWAAMIAAASSDVNIAPAVLSAPYSSVHSRPLDICSIWRTVMAWRGSPGACHSGTGGCSSRVSMPSSTSMPMRADVKLLATENELFTTSAPSSGW